MRVTLIGNFFFGAEDIGPQKLLSEPHLGLLSLATVAEGAGHEVTVYDPGLELAEGRLGRSPEVYDQVARAVLDTAPDVVGLTSIGASFLFPVHVSRRLRALARSLPLVAGGPHVSIAHREIACAFDTFDVLVRGEAEPTIGPLLEALPDPQALRSIDGLTFRDGDHLVSTAAAGPIEDLDTLPDPAWHLWPFERASGSEVLIEAGRGCPFACTFCSTASFFTRRYRVKSPARILHEADTLHARYGFTHFILVHDLFTVDKRYVRRFCEAMLSRPHYTWQCSARVDCVDFELLELMRAAGCTNVYFGVETGSPRMQRSLKKRLSVELVQPTIAKVAELGMTATASFITGYPTETPEDQAETLHMIERLRTTALTETTSIQFHVLHPGVGTEITQQHFDQMTYDGNVFGAESNYHFIGPDDGELLRAHPYIFSNYLCFDSPTMPRARQLLAAAVTRELLSLPPGLLRGVLAACGQSMAELVDQVHDRDPAPTLLATDNAWLVHHHLQHKLGAHHPTTATYAWWSLIRRLRRDTTPASIPVPGWYLSPRAAFVRDLPDGPSLLQWVTNRPEEAPPETLCSERSDFLVFVGPEPDARLNVAPLVDELRVLASLEAVPVSEAAMIQQLRESSSLAEIEIEGLMEQLRGSGVLVHCSGAGH